MLTDDGYFDHEWLYQQTTERLRYEARCEHVQGWETLQRHTLLLVLRQIRIAPFSVANLEKKYNRWVELNVVNMGRNGISRTTSESSCKPGNGS